jgi:transposase-like protein/predicted RNA-binding Zn-ribbon protein involved in translation (DUF1610 family)
MKKYTIKDFNKEYPNDDACLDALFINRYGDYKCPDCGLQGRFHRIEGRKRYDCQCGHSVHPVAGTIFHKSPTSLHDWFHAIFLFASSRNGVAAKEIERQVGVTYKCAWRMAKQIRLLFAQNGTPLNGTVEMDETYVGGRGRNNKRGRGAENKTPVFGIVQREGNIKAVVVSNVQIKTIQPIINASVEKGSSVMTDEFNIYNHVARNGYWHEKVEHAVKEYVRGKIHTNTIEGFWSQLKRSLDGTHHVVSPKYLQTYVDEFVYRRNALRNEASLFETMIAQVAKRA